MNLMFLLGSGISRPTLGDNVGTCKGITDAILSYAWHRHGDFSYMLGVPQGETAKIYDTVLIQNFLKRLKLYVEDYYRSHGGWEVTYEDLFYLADQIRDEESDLKDNPGIAAFRQEIWHNIQDLLGYQTWTEYVTLKLLAEESRNFIKCAVKCLLSTSNNSSGLDSIIEVLSSKCFASIDVFTLNHDTILEKALLLKNIDFTDGFDNMINGVRWFKPTLYKKRKLRIFKLHGSINWQNLPSGIGILKANEPKTRIGRRIRNFDIDPIPIVIAGTYNKEERYYFDIIAEMHWRFYQSLRNQRNTLLVVTGYGWNDRSITNRIMEWVWLKPKNRILLVHENPKIIKKSKSYMDHDYDKLKEQGKLITVPKWPKDLQEGEFTDAIIKSLEGDSRNDSDY